jgi:malate permease and related proteins
VLGTLTNAVLPVFIMAGLGAILGRTLKLDPRPVSRLALYIFSPALIFGYLSTADIPVRDVLNVFAFIAVWLPLLYIFCWTVANRAGLRGQAQSAFLLSTLFMNAMNYGLPVSLLAFGEEGLQRALLFLAPQALMAGTLAVYVASRGQAGNLRALLTVFRMPMFYATVMALAVNPLNITLPTPIDTPLQILGGAAIPVMVMVLGIQLASASFREDLLPAGAAAAVRLVASPALAYGVTLLLGVHGVTQQVVIVLAGMPSAVYTTILATEFNARPRQVTTSVALSTVVSLITVSTLVWLVSTFL